MAEFAFSLPINSVSFGQVSTGLLKEAFSRSLNPSLFPIGNIDLSTQDIEENFQEWLQFCTKKGTEEHDRTLPVIKLWHLAGSLESFSQAQILLTFYEVDAPTKAELNVAKNHKTVFTSEYSKEVFDNAGAETYCVPLFFDEFNFKRVMENDQPKKYFEDERITFNLTGKFEKRKHHHKIIKSWLKRFGNDNEYHLQACVYNNFFPKEQNIALFQGATNGQRYSNINFLNYMPTNDLYNDYLNSADVIIGMSGGEGWGLPEFHSVGLGKHGVILNAHGYKGWANEENSIFVQPKEKIDSYDDVFFKEGMQYNQGQIFDFDEEEFIFACETAIEKVKENRVNEAGLKIQEDFPVSKTLDSLLELL